MAEGKATDGSAEDVEREIGRLQKAMKSAARKLEFEKAGELRDRIRELKQLELFADLEDKF